MDALRIVRNIVNEAFAKAEKNGDSKYVVAEATLEVWLQNAVEAIDKRNAGSWFYDHLKEYDHE